jgi:dihydrofolate reductase
MTNSVYIATSLDGYIATPNGGIEWLNTFSNPTDSDYGYHEFIDGIDAIVMGRKTFELVSSFSSWPYSKKVFVLSNHLQEIKPELVDRAEVVSGDLNTIVKKLHRDGYQNLYIDGGKAIQSFLKKNLIDELIISKVPIVLGDGIPLFAAQDQMVKFEHCSTEVFEGGLVKSHYKKI